MIMIPYVLDTSFNRVAMFDDFISFIWSSRFYECGDFELVVPVSEKALTYLKADNYICREDDENTGIIEDIKISRLEDGQERMIISGRFLGSILERRIVSAQTTLSGTVSSCLNTLINDNICHPQQSSRKISNFSFESFYMTQTMNAQYTGKNLLNIITDVCKTYGVGFKVRLLNGLFVFSIYDGLDRTYDQNDRLPVVFSDVYDNLLGFDYEECYKNQVTAVLVAGEGEGQSRKMAWATDGTEGLLRREAFKEEKNISSNNSAISIPEYIALLEESGKESITQYTTAFTGQVYFDDIKYGTDVKLGDICVIQNKRWNLSVNARLVEVVESVSETGAYTITPTFGV